MSKAIDKKVMISVHDLYKTFRLPTERHSSVKQVFLGIFTKKHYIEQQVLHGISFDVYEGDFFGIVGRNGSGKSTLLKILAGIYTYDSGSVGIQGKISPFLELGVGFNPELTGWENIYLNGALLGLEKKEIDSKIDEIIEFSELSDFMDQKLKNYSSGMQVRLAFSVAIHAHAPIILLDEVLAVGDSNFQRKCQDVFVKLKKEGRTIVFVSHSMPNIRKFCNRAILVDKGKIISEGNPDDVSNVYESINLETKNLDKSFASSNVSVRGLEMNKGNLLIDEAEDIEIVFDLDNKTNKEMPLNLAFDIENDGCKVGGNCTNYGKEDGYSLRIEPGKSGLSVKLAGGSLLPGDYVFGYRLFGVNTGDIYARQAEAIEFKIKGSKAKIGSVDLHEEITLKKRG